METPYEPWEDRSGDEHYDLYERTRADRNVFDKRWVRIVAIIVLIVLLFGLYQFVIFYLIHPPTPPANDKMAFLALPGFPRC